jgi:hypothetical protein
MVLAVPAVTTSCPPVRSPAGTSIIGGATANVKVVLPESRPEEARMVTSFVPTVRGMPDRTPLVESDKPCKLFAVVYVTLAGFVALVRNV